MKRGDPDQGRPADKGVRRKAALPGRPVGPPRHRPFALAAVGLAVLAAGGAYLFHLRKPLAPAPKGSASSVAGAGYVDAAACAGCHQGIWDTYRRTGMGRSFTRLEPATVVEDYTRRNTYYHAASDRHYTMYRKDGKYFQRRHQSGFGGAETNVVEKEAHFILGSGNHSRSYLHQTAEGRLVELPVGWFSERGGFWAMNPGFDRPDHDDFRRQITYQCMFCHNGYPETPAGADASGTAPVFGRTLPQGIDCQRCHGPGRAHVTAMQNGGGSPEMAQKTIVNPSRLSPERQLELCMQCHLESTSFRLPHAIVRYTRGIFSYRPGQPLAEYVLHYDHPAGTGHDDKFEIVNAAYRLRQSACFQKSGGALQCTTCHNPHDIPRGEAAARHYAGVCLRCHGGPLEKQVAAKRHPASQDCQGCHMPKRRTEDVVHVVMTDHRIQRRKPARDLLAPLAERVETDETAYRGEVVPYYPAQPEGAAGELYLAVAQVRQSANLETGIPRLEAALQKYRPAEAEFYFELAEAYRNHRQPEKAIGMYEEALRRQPGFRPAVQKLGATLGRSGRLAEAAAVLEKAVAAGPPEASVLNDLGLAYIGLGKRREAIETLRRALQLDPDFPDAYNNLGGVLLEAGEQAGAEAAYRNAIRVQPEMAEAHKNLANLVAAAGRFTEAEYHYQKALRGNPRYAVAYYDYGIALAQQQRFREAQQQFEAAVRVDANLAEAHNALGEMLGIQGDAKRAVEAYRRAVALRPELPVAHSNLGTALLLLGRGGEAKAHLERAVGLNPELWEAHLQLGKVLALERDQAGAAAHFRKAAEGGDPEIRRAAAEALRQQTGR